MGMQVNFVSQTNSILDPEHTNHHLRASSAKPLSITEILSATVSL